MGLFDWLKGDSAAPEPDQVPIDAPPTPEEIADSLAKIDQLAVDGRVPPAVLTRVYRVTRKLRETLPRMRNAGLDFVCRDVALTVENARTMFTARYDAGSTIRIPVAHHDGNYVADADVLDRLEGEGRVVFRYAEAVNGSARNIAGIINDGGNVLGLMPHPERLIEPAQGGTDGRAMFEALHAALG